MRHLRSLVKSLSSPVSRAVRQIGRRWSTRPVVTIIERRTFFLNPSTNAGEIGDFFKWNFSREMRNIEKGQHFRGRWGLNGAFLLVTKILWNAKYLTSFSHYSQDWFTVGYLSPRKRNKYFHAPLLSEGRRSTHMRINSRHQKKPILLFVQKNY